DFNDLFNPTSYWAGSNNSATQQSVNANTYIPEVPWNDTCTNSVFGAPRIGFSTDPEANCNNPQLIRSVATTGGSGGASASYAKPPWQIGNGVPSDLKRDVPDVSLFASDGFFGHFYVLCERDYPGSTGACSVSNFLGVGGTSAASPNFAGIMAMIVQKTGTRWGNPNYVLYNMANQPGNSCTSAPTPASTCAFYDIPSGFTNAMPCATGSPNCTTKTAGDAYGVLSGFATTGGYDQASGLGSVNAANLVNKWAAIKLTPSSTTLSLTPPAGTTLSTLTHGQAVSATIGVSGTGGPPTGNVSLVANEAPNGSTGTDGVGSFVLNNGTASGSTNALPGGTYNVVAQYPGDGTFASSSSAPVSVTVGPEASKVQILYELFDPNTGAITNSNATSAVFGAPSLLRVNVTSAAGDACASNISGELGCPTGAIALSDSGTSLGTFGLNSLGYAEDQTIDLAGGSHTIAASYSGDASYTAPSPASQVVTITPASTTTTVNVGAINPTVGGVVYLSANILAQNIYSNHAPTGTVTFFSDGTQVATGSVIGTITSFIHQGGGFASGNTSSLTHGPHNITAQYSGDASYALSTSAAVGINVLYPTTMSVNPNPNGVIYGQGTSVTVTATVSTGEPASNVALKPGGAITFACTSTSGSITNSTGQDANGNWILQASYTTTPQQTETICANYSGDSNYAASSQVAQITVTVPDFNLSLPSAPLVITAGQTGTATLTITPLTNYTTTVDLSCGTLLRVPIPGTTCTISPSSVTLSNGNAVNATLSLATVAPSTTLTADIPIGRLRSRHMGPPARRDCWTVAAVAGIAALLCLLIPETRRRRRTGFVFAAAAVLSFSIGCGGGASGGSAVVSNPSPPPPPQGPVATTTSLTAGSAKIPLGGSTSLSATVKSTGSPTGFVNFNDASFPSVIAPNVSLLNGTAQTQMNATGSVFPGTHVITAQYMGDGNNLTSQSGAINIVVTGNNTESVIAQTGPLSHYTNLNVTIQ
ncbi:MAG: Ig-like domain repeat protein, partial [Acidobacteriota bacterium]|nr:Ig-like domain repeat protein [Acidobacteriota bacterium]